MSKTFDTGWELMKSDSQGCDVCGETDGLFTYMDNNKRAHMVCSDACMDKNKGKGTETTSVLGGGRMVKSEEKNDEKNEEKVAPLVAGAARVGAAAAKNPKVQQAAGNLIGGAVSGMMQKKSFDTAWSLMLKNAP